ALDGLGALRESEILIALNDRDATVREHGIKLSEKFNAAPAQELFSRLLRLTNDAAMTVRYQLAFTLGEFNLPGRIAALSAIVANDLESSWIRAAVLSSLREGAGELFTQLAGNPAVSDSKAGHDFLRELIGLIAVRNKPGEVGQVFDFITGVKDQSLCF